MVSRKFRHTTLINKLMNNFLKKYWILIWTGVPAAFGIILGLIFATIPTLISISFIGWLFLGLWCESKYD